MLCAAQCSKRARPELRGAALIRRSEISVEDSVRAGSERAVCSGVCRGQRVTVDSINLDEKPEMDCEELERELRTMCALSSPNVSFFFGACVDRTKGGDCVQHNELLLVSEPFQMTVYDLLFAQDDVPVTPHLALLIAQDAALGLYWLHRTVTWGWGVRLENIRLDRSYRAKVANPTFAGADRDEKSDVCEYGFVFHFLIAVADVWGEPENVEKLRRAYHAGELPPLPSDVSREVANVAEWCRCADRSVRPLFSSVVSLVNQAVLSSAVPDKAAREWWYDRFSTTESLLPEVGWKTFKKEFLDSFVNCERWANPNRSSSSSSTGGIDGGDDSNVSTDSSNGKSIDDIVVARTGRGVDSEWGNPRCILSDEINAAISLLYDCTVIDGDHSTAMPTSVELLRGTTQQGVVTLERFGNFVTCFGGLAHPQEFFANVSVVSRDDNFFGNISRREAELCLQGRVPGTSLLRFSENRRGFVLSMVASKKKETDQSFPKETILHINLARPYASLFKSE